MTRIWGKSELGFALVWIAVYLLGNSLGAELSGALGIKNCVTAVFHLGMGLFLFFWIRKNGLAERYGLCGPESPAGGFLGYIPLVILSSVNLWNGVTVNLPVMDTVFSVCAMIGAGFLEELLFRGFLFRAVSRSGVKRGAVISGVSFGLGHSLNLFSGRGMGVAQIVWQIIFAAAFGFLCAIIFYRKKTLWPCILTHAAFNAAGVFAREADAAGPMRIFQHTAALVLVIGYAWLLAKTLPENSAKAKS